MVTRIQCSAIVLVLAMSDKNLFGTRYANAFLSIGYEKSLFFVPKRLKVSCGNSHRLKSSHTDSPVEEIKNFNPGNELNVAISDLVSRVEETGEIELVFEAEKLLNSGKQALYDTSKTNGQVNTESYNMVMRAWKVATQKFADGRAILPRNLDGKHHDGGDVYTTRDAARRAQRILKQCEDDYVVSNIITSGNQKSSNNDGGGSTSSIVADTDGISSIRPDVSGYNTIIDVWAKSKLSESCQNALSVLEHMNALHQKGFPKDDGSFTEPWDWLEPNVITYNTLIDACGNMKYNSNSDNNHIKSKTYNSKGAETAEKLFRLMKTKTHLKPTTRTYNNLINVWSSSFDPHSYKPTEQSQRAAKRAQQLLDELNQLYESSERDPQIKPDVATYTTVIDCIGRSHIRDAPEKAEALLLELEERFHKSKDHSLKPNIRTYTGVIYAWSRSKNSNAPHRAEQILQKIESQSLNAKKMIPNIRTYCTVISCWNRSQELTKPQRALRILRHVVDQYRITKDDNIKPNLFIYNAVIDSCAKCPAREHDYPKQQRAALKIAFAVLKAIRLDESIAPDQVTYALLFKSVTNLLPRIDDHEQKSSTNSREEIVRKLFESAKKEGMIDQSVLKQMRQCVGSDFFLALIGDHSQILDKKTGRIDFSKMPHEWGKHVK